MQNLTTNMWFYFSNYRAAQAIFSIHSTMTSTINRKISLTNPVSYYERTLNILQFYRYFLLLSSTLVFYFIFVSFVLHDFLFLFLFRMNTINIHHHYIVQIGVMLSQEVKLIIFKLFYICIIIYSHQKMVDIMSTYLQFYIIKVFLSRVRRN